MNAVLDGMVRGSIKMTFSQDSDCSCLVFPQSVMLKVLPTIQMTPNYEENLPEYHFTVFNGALYL